MTRLYSFRSARMYYVIADHDPGPAQNRPSAVKITLQKIHAAGMSPVVGAL